MFGVSQMIAIMKHFTIRTVTVIIVQQLAMIFFMRVVCLDLFSSSGLSALIAMIVGVTIYFVEKRIAARRDRV